MFNILESTWDRSARRSWTTLASFGFQAMAVSLLLLVPLIWVQGPPKLSWLKTTEFLAPPTGAQTPPDTVERHQTPRSTNIAGDHVIAPPSIPHDIAILHEQPIVAAPNIDDAVPGGTGLAGRREGIWKSLGNNTAIAPPPLTSAPTHPIRLSHWAEGNLIYRVQPVYPELARQVRIQGAVQLHAIISKTGTIEHLAAVSGHPMLIPAALNAVRQWRYRPYLLNGEPVEVETEITVNFILAEN